MVKHSIKIEEIYDYAFCPMYYKLKHIDKEFEKDIELLEKYDKDIKTIINVSMLKLQSGERIRIEDLKVQWGKLWIKDKRKASVVYKDTVFNKDIYNIKRKKGLSALLYFQKEFESTNAGIPIVIDKEFSIDITNNLVLHGRFDSIIKKGNIVDICIFSNIEHGTKKINSKYNIKVNAIFMAIDKYVNAKNKRVIIYNMDKLKKEKVTIKNINIKSFKNTVISIYKAIYNKLFYIVPSDKCSCCIYKELCYKSGGDLL